MLKLNLSVFSTSGAVIWNCVLPRVGINMFVACYSSPEEPEAEATLLSYKDGKCQIEPQRFQQDSGRYHPPYLTGGFRKLRLQNSYEVSPPSRGNVSCSLVGLSQLSLPQTYPLLASPFASLLSADSSSRSSTSSGRSSNEMECLELDDNGKFM